MKCTWKFVLYTRHSMFTSPDLTLIGAIFSKHLKFVLLPKMKLCLVTFFWRVIRVDYNNFGESLNPRLGGGVHL